MSHEHGKKIRSRLKGGVCFGLLFAITAVGAKDPKGEDYYRLTITDSQGDEHVFTTEELLRRKDLETITIKDDPAYPRRNMTYKAVRFANLLDSIALTPDATVEFVARDGFTAPLDAGLLKNTSPEASVAYLAIEEPRNK